MEKTIFPVQKREFMPIYENFIQSFFSGSKIDKLDKKKEVMESFFSFKNLKGLKKDFMKNNVENFHDSD